MVAMLSCLHSSIFFHKIPLELGKIGAWMYKGEKITRTKNQELENHSRLGGEIPTWALQLSVL